MEAIARGGFGIGDEYGVLEIINIKDFRVGRG